MPNKDENLEEVRRDALREIELKRREVLDKIKSEGK